MMRASHPARLQDCSAQAIIAAFDQWQDLRSALEPLRAEEGCCFRAVLHARKDLPDDPQLLDAVNEVAELECTPSRQRIAPGKGALAGILAAAFARGARSLAAALQPWMSPEQAKQLENHVVRGRVLLWVQPLDSEQFGCLCGHLVRASPHVVEVCDLFLQNSVHPRQSQS